MMHTLARPAPCSSQDQSDPDHRVTDTVGYRQAWARLPGQSAVVPPVPRNVVGEITSLVAPPRAIAGLWSRRRRGENEERGVRIKMRNRNA